MSPGSPFPDLTTLSAALGPDRMRTRFAPSPTGYLHMGHVVNALYVWGIARAVGGEVVLRMENHDTERFRAEYETATLQDLEWLGLQPDIGLPAAFRAGATDYRQSDCEPHYVAAVERLQGHTYFCDCSRREVRERSGQGPGEELRYDGFCRDRGLEKGTLRCCLPACEVHFMDLLQGPQVQHPLRETGDPSLRDRRGNWTYQHAVVVDDLRHGINVVIRGLDILPSTGRQILLREALGEPQQPLWLHHGLLVNTEGVKLSKRNFDAGIRKLAEAGEDAAWVLGQAAALAGLLPEPRPLRGEADLAELFSNANSK